MFVSSSVLAFDDLITIESYPVIHELGSLSFGGNLAFFTAGDKYDKDSEKQSLADDATNLRIPLHARYTPMENLEAFAIIPILSMDDGMDTESGIGDVWIGAKYGIMPEGFLTVRAALNLGTGDDEKGLGNAGGFGLDVGVIHQKMIIEDKFGARVQAGIRWMAEDSDTKWQPGIGVYATAGVGYVLMEQTWLTGGIEIMTYGEGSADGTDMDDSNVMDLDLQIGLGRTISEMLGGSIMLEVPLTGTMTKADMGVMVSVWYMVQ